MIARAFVAVDGPPSSGKTTFIERLLAASRKEVLLAARFLTAKSPRTAGPTKGNAETARFLAAGAFGAAAFRFGATADPDAFWATDFVAFYSRGIIFEGDLPRKVATPDLAVHVVRPLPEGEQLLSRHEWVVDESEITEHLERIASSSLGTLLAAKGIDVRGELRRQFEASRPTGQQLGRARGACGRATSVCPRRGSSS